MSTPVTILAGGLSSRMGGGDKCLCHLAGMSFLEHIIAILAEQTDAILINSNSAPQLFHDSGLEVRPDVIAGRLGPLAGILTAMHWAREIDAPFVITVPSDTPFLPGDLVPRLMEARSEPCAVVAASGGRLHPIIGLWPVALAGQLRLRIEQGMRRARLWLETIAFKTVPFDITDGDPFSNINTPSDWGQANARVYQI